MPKVRDDSFMPPGYIGIESFWLQATDGYRHNNLAILGQRLHRQVQVDPDGGKVSHVLDPRVSSVGCRH
jgi:hypothetical protein